jgi:predicted acetyltransferase
VPELITPTVRLHRQWLDARDDWGRGVHQDGSGLRPTDDVDSAAGFADWVARLRNGPEGRDWVPCTYWWIADGYTVLGSIALRHELDDDLLQRGGHIGYGIRPSARRRGLASWALGEVLTAARERDIGRVLIACAVTNEASRRVIEHHNGVREDERDGKYRYWIDLS